MGWKPEHAESRRNKYQSDPEERGRRLAQSRSGEANSEYMREYYKANPDKFRRTPEQRAEYNRRRRERYANDPEYRERVKRQAVSGVDPERKRDTRLRKQFGIGAAEYDQLLTEQNGGCAICGARFSHGEVRLAVDHCHDTGKVRGLLCSNCNQGLGKFGDDPDRLDRAGMYLRAHRRAPETDQ